MSSGVGRRMSYMLYGRCERVQECQHGRHYDCSSTVRNTLQQHVRIMVSSCSFVKRFFARVRTFIYPCMCSSSNGVCVPLGAAHPLASVCGDKRRECICPTTQFECHQCCKNDDGVCESVNVRNNSLLYREIGAPCNYSLSTWLVVNLVTARSTPRTHSLTLYITH